MARLCALNRKASPSREDAPRHLPPLAAPLPAPQIRTCQRITRLSAPRSQSSAAMAEGQAFLACRRGSMKLALPSCGLSWGSLGSGGSAEPPGTRRGCSVARSFLAADWQLGQYLPPSLHTSTPPCSVHSRSTSRTVLSSILTPAGSIPRLSPPAPGQRKNARTVQINPAQR